MLEVLKPVGNDTIKLELNFPKNINTTISNIMNEITEISRGGILLGNIYDFGYSIKEIIETDGGDADGFTLNLNEVDRYLRNEQNYDKTLIGVWRTSNQDYAYPNLKDLSCVPFNWNIEDCYPIQLIIARKNCHIMNVLPVNLL